MHWVKENSVDDLPSTENWLTGHYLPAISFMPVELQELIKQRIAPYIEPMTDVAGLENWDQSKLVMKTKTYKTFWEKLKSYFKF